MAPPFTYVELEMVVSTVFESPDLLTATVSGALTGADQARLVESIRDWIGRRGAIRALLLLDQFTGWFPNVGAVDDAAMWLRDDERVVRIAIVGEAKWKRQVLTTAAQPLRGIPIEYFETEADARTWLGPPNTTSRPDRAAT